ncbi:MAG: hypothetical protein ACRCVA_18435 [Phreatobacter sp.]
MPRHVKHAWVAAKRALARHDPSTIGTNGRLIALLELGPSALPHASTRRATGDRNPMTSAPTAVVAAAEARGDQLAAHYRRIGIPAVSAATSSAKASKPAAPATPARRKFEDFVD